jgi:hypothetical protein
MDGREEIAPVECLGGDGHAVVVIDDVVEPGVELLSGGQPGVQPTAQDESTC